MLKPHQQNPQPPLPPPSALRFPRSNTLALTPGFPLLKQIRFLSLVQPVYPRLGPLLITVGKMMGEIVAFAVPYAFVLSGFATLFSGA